MKKNPIALFTYQTLSRRKYYQGLPGQLSDYRKRIGATAKDFGKPNIERFGARNQDWQSEAADVSVEETTDAHRVVVGLGLKDDEACYNGSRGISAQGLH